MEYYIKIYSRIITVSDGYVIVVIAILHHSPKDGFENIRIDPRQLVIIQFDEWIVAYKHEIKSIPCKRIQQKWRVVFYLLKKCQVRSEWFDFETNRVECLWQRYRN